MNTSLQRVLRPLKAGVTCRVVQVGSRANVIIEQNGPAETSRRGWS